MTYGTKALIPVEIGMPGFRVHNFNEETNEEGLKANLDLVEEVRDQVYFKMQVDKRRVARFFNRQVRGRQFKEGDWVTRKAEKSQPQQQGKLAPNWEGPYEVIKAYTNGAYKLRTREEKILPRTWNAENLKKFYF